MATRIPKFIAPFLLPLALLAAPAYAMHPATWFLTGDPGPDEATVEITGSLELPDGLDPRDYIVVNSFSRDTPDEEGNFTVTARAVGPTVTAAVHRGAAGSDANPFVGVFILNEVAAKSQRGEEALMRVSSAEDAGIVISARTTAKSAVLANPLVISRNPLRMRILDGTLESLPELDSLEAIVASLFPGNPDPFSDPEFIAALELLYDGIENALPPIPPHPFPETLEPGAKGEGGVRVLQLPRGTFTPEQKSSHEGISVSFSQLDRMRQIEYRRGAFDPMTGRIEIDLESTELLPLDSVAIIRKLDPRNRYVYTAGPHTDRLRSVQHARRLKNIPGAFPLFEGERDGLDVQWNHLPAKSLFRYVNIVSTVVRLAVEAAGQGLDEAFEFDLPEGGSTTVEPEDGVYILRTFTGKIYDGMQDTPGEMRFSWDEFQQEQLWAFSMNLAAGALDAIDLIVGMRLSACRQPVLNLTKTFAKDLLQQVLPGIVQGGVDVQRLIEILLRDFIGNSITAYLACLAEHPLETLGTFVKSVLTLEQFTRRAAAIGQISDRLTALFNLPLGGVVGIYATPMDTVIVVVGDPFSPVLEEVSFTDWQGEGRIIDLAEDFEADPHGIMALSEVSLRGRRLHVPGDPQPRLFVVDVYNEPIPVEFENVEDLNSDPFPLQEITFNLPREAAGPFRLELRTDGGRTRMATPSIGEIVPIIEDVTPRQTFSYVTGGNPFPYSIELRGIGIFPERHRVVLGGALMHFGPPPDRDRIRFVPLRTDDIDPGLHDVQIRWREGEPPVSAPEPIDLLIFGDPVIDSVSPETVPPRGAVSVIGKNFGTQIFREYGEVSARYLERGTDVQIGSAASVRLLQTQPTSPDGEDQLARMLITDAPFVSEDTEADLVITTPMGASNRYPVILSARPQPAYTRTVRNHYNDGTIVETAQTVLSWASQNPHPGGTRQWFLRCAGPSGTCPDSSPRFITQAADDVPDDTSPMYLFSSDDGRLVTLPPGRDPAVLAAPEGNCSTCDSGGQFNLTGSDGPNSWEGITSLEIQDTVRLIGSIHGTFTGTNASIVDQRIPASDPVPNVIDAGGLTLQGAAHTTVDLAPDSISAGTLITIRNSYDIEVNLDISESTTGSANIGIFIENSARVTVNGTIRNCQTGVLVLNSEHVVLRANVYTSGISGIAYDIRGGEGHFLNGPEIFGTGRTSEGPVGVRLRSGNRATIVSGLRAHGLHTALNIQDASEAVLFASRIGGPLPFGVSGFDRGNTVGIRIEPDAARNLISGVELQSNDIGLYMTGGTENHIIDPRLGDMHGQTENFNRIGMLVEGTGHPFEGNKFDFIKLLANHEAGLVVDGVDDPLLFNTTTSDSGFTSPPPSYKAHIFVRNSSNLQFPNNDVRFGPVGILIEDSENILLQGPSATAHTDAAIRAERTHGLRIIRGEINGANGGSFVTPKGIHLIGCSNIQFSAMDILHFTEAGIYMEQPPTESFGISRFVGHYRLPGQTAPAQPPPREEHFAPMNRPPHDQYQSNRLLFIRSNEGHGIVIRDGAQDVYIAGAQINTVEGHSLYLHNAGHNIKLESSSLQTLQGQMQNDAAIGYDHVRIQNTTAGEIHIGGPEAGNLLERSRGRAVHIIDSDDIIVRGNYIGVRANGISPEANELGGVVVADSGNVTIGGPDPLDGNLISAHGTHGILVESSEGTPAGLVRIEGNFIGVDSLGVEAVPNTGYGILARAPNGTAPGGLQVTMNLISGNELGGIAIEGLDGRQAGIVIDENIIGRAFPFGVFGVFVGAEDNPGNALSIVESQNVYTLGNRIAYHGGDGILVNASDRNMFQENASFNHDGHGVRIAGGSDLNRIELNDVANNEGGGIRVESASWRNSLSANVIHGHEGDAISLRTAGNAMIPAPIICDVGIIEQPDGSQWYFASGLVMPGIPDGARIELFMSNSGEADQFLIHTITEDEQWFSFITEVDVGPAPTFIPIAATVTDLEGNTSELGHYDPNDPHPLCLDVPPPPPPDPDDPPSHDPDDEEFDRYNIPVAFERDGQLFLVHLATGIESEIDTTETGRDRFGRPSLTRYPDAERWIAFEAYDADGNVDIFIMPADDEATTPPINLTDHPAEDIEPSLSPDGKLLAFSSNRNGSFDIFVIDLEEGDLLALLEDEHNNRRPDWNWDGEERKIVFLSNREGANRLYIYDFATGSTEELETGFDEYTLDEPAWGKFDNLIAFEATHEDNGTQTVGWYDLSQNNGFLLRPRGWNLHQPDWVSTGTGRPALVYTRTNDLNEEPTMIYSTRYGQILWRVTTEETNHPSVGARVPRE